MPTQGWVGVCGEGCLSIAKDQTCLLGLALALKRGTVCPVFSSLTHPHPLLVHVLEAQSVAQPASPRASPDRSPGGSTPVLLSGVFTHLCSGFPSSWSDVGVLPFGGLAPHEKKAPLEGRRLHPYAPSPWSTVPHKHSPHPVEIHLGKGPLLPIGVLPGGTGSHPGLLLQTFRELTSFLCLVCPRVFVCQVWACTGCTPALSPVDGPRGQL